MSSKSTTKDNGAKVATSKKPKNGTGKSTAKAPTHYELLPQEEASDNNSQATTSEMESKSVSEGTETGTKNVEVAAAKAKPKKVVAATAKAKPKKVEAPTAKSQTKKVAQKKVVSNGKSSAGSNKKVRLAASTYHYYRNWLAEFMRSHGVSSAKFQKSPESYEGHITVSETEKAKGLKALEQWSKQNPDTKELFWDIKK
jgi:hypothetical protein